MRSFYSLILLILFSFMLLFSSNTMAKERLKVFVSILPQKYFVERITGENAVVEVLVKPGKSPGTYSPSPDQIRELSNSDIYFRIGVPFENGFMHKIESIANSIKIVDTRKGIVLRDMRDHDHKRDHEKHHDHVGKDPHIWLNPILVKTMAKTILDELLKIDLNNKKYYTRNYHQFINDLDQLNDNLKNSLKELKGGKLFVFHPAFGYFTDAYGLEQIAIETMGKAPKGKQLSKIIKLVKKEKVRVIFVQPQFDSYTAQKIARSIQGSVVPIDPLSYDYLSNMKTIASTILMDLKNKGLKE